MTFTFTQKVLFKYCDPAGIVFYPRYFEMLNDCVETFFEQELDCPFEEMHPDFGVPTAQIEAQFKAPCRHGDVLNIHLACTALGNSSLALEFRTECDGQTRFLAQSTLVHIDAKGRPTSWPESLRGKIIDFMERTITK